MNEKKAKRLRQLVRHLMEKNAIAPKGWRIYSAESRVEAINIPTDSGSTRTINVAVGTQRLDKDCGRYIYNQMKKRAALQRTA